jgi:hypothetical protein
VWVDGCIQYLYIYISASSSSSSSSSSLPSQTHTKQSHNTHPTTPKHITNQGLAYWEVRVEQANWGSVFIGVAPRSAASRPGWQGYGFLNYRAVQVRDGANRSWAAKTVSRPSHVYIYQPPTNTPPTPTPTPTPTYTHTNIPPPHTHIHPHTGVRVGDAVRLVLRCGGHHRGAPRHGPGHFGLHQGACPFLLFTRSCVIFFGGGIVGGIVMALCDACPFVHSLLYMWLYDVAFHLCMDVCEVDLFSTAQPSTSPHKAHTTPLSSPSLPLLTHTHIHKQTFLYTHTHTHTHTHQDGEDFNVGRPVVLHMGVAYHYLRYERCLSALT